MTSGRRGGGRAGKMEGVVEEGSSRYGVGTTSTCNKRENRGTPHWQKGKIVKISQAEDKS